MKKPKQNNKDKSIKPNQAARMDSSQTSSITSNLANDPISHSNFFHWVLSKIPAAAAHELAPLVLPLFANVKSLNPEAYIWKDFTWTFKNKSQLYFRNPLGIAGGVDKSGELALTWQKLGAGFVEIGTVTPYPQNANPGKTLDRDWKRQNLWNKMGFPGPGMKDVFMTLLYQYADLEIPLFINIGKNRNTSNENAIKDYLTVIQQFANMADAFVINISSPNTSNLRDLQNDEFIKNLCTQAKLLQIPVPILLKLSPDLSRDDLQQTIESGIQNDIDGFILTNTTLQRPSHVNFPSVGGLSGRDLQEISIQNLKDCLQILGNKKSETLVISVGGVLHPKDAVERLDLGADLVQTYSGLVFTGPDFFIKTIRN